MEDKSNFPVKSARFHGRKRSLTRVLGVGFVLITVAAICLMTVSFSDYTGSDEVKGKSHEDRSGNIRPSTNRHHSVSRKGFHRKDDNTNPDEPNPKILIRVPRQSVLRRLIRHFLGSRRVYDKPSTSKNITYPVIGTRSTLLDDEQHWPFATTTSPQNKTRRKRAANPFGAFGPRPVVHKKKKPKKVLRCRNAGRNETVCELVPQVIDHLAHTRPKKPLTAHQKRLQKKRSGFKTSGDIMWEKLKKSKEYEKKFRASVKRQELNRKNRKKRLQQQIRAKHAKLAKAAKKWKRLPQSRKKQKFTRYVPKRYKLPPRRKRPVLKRQTWMPRTKKRTRRIFPVGTKVAVKRYKAKPG